MIFRKEDSRTVCTRTNYNNNPYGAYITASAELKYQIASAQGQQTQQLGWSQGFFSKAKCVDTQGVIGGISQATGDPPQLPTNQQTCEAFGGTWMIQTPGTLINAQLQEVLGSGQRQLELADEIDEIISALMAQLGQKALTSLDGLSGLSSKTSSSATTQGSYLDQLTNTTDTGAVTASREVLVMNVTGSASLEQDYQSVLGNELSVLSDEHGILAARYQCYAGLSDANASTNATTASSTLAVVISEQHQYQTESTTTARTSPRSRISNNR